MTYSLARDNRSNFATLRNFAVALATHWQLRTKRQTQNKQTVVFLKTAFKNEVFSRFMILAIYWLFTNGESMYFVSDDQKKLNAKFKIQIV